MAIVGLTGVSHYYGDNFVLKDVSLGIESHHRCGLVGENGTGKTTLLDIISGNLTPCEGEVFVGKKTNLAYLRQSLQIKERCDLLTYILRTHERVLELSRLISELEEKLRLKPDSHYLRLLDKYQTEFNMLEGYSLEHRAKTILQRLSFPEEVWWRDVSSFSGGEQTRIQLAGVLLSPADILLLDEPTNHLDIAMRDWLARYLTEIRIPYLIVSHDRYFLEQTTNRILALENKKIVSYSGSYSFYEKEHKLKTEQQEKEFQAQQKYIEDTKYFIRKNIAGQKTKQAKSRLKALNRLELIDKPQASKKMGFSIESLKRSGNIVFKIDNVACKYPDNVLVEEVNHTVTYQDRVAVLGKNGCGKTTFLQVLAGEKEATQGKVVKGAKLSIGYYDQLHVSLSPNLAIGETVKNEHPEWTVFDLLSFLARFGFFEEDLDKKVSNLSGGEKARLYLALVISRKPNVLIMDEPTNHLDIHMIESLEKALQEYDGTIIFISHDRYFINNVANRYWVFHNKTIKETHKWEDLLLSDETRSNVSKKGRRQNKHYEPDYCNRKQKGRRVNKINPILLDKKLKDIEALEKDIACKEKELEDLQSRFLNKDTFMEGDRVKKINIAINRVRSEIIELRKELSEKEDDYLMCLE